MPTRIKSLLLSGGGYRAAAFHIGVVRWLYEHSQTEKGECALKGIEHVVGVSGGAITAAHLVTHFNDYCDGFTAALRLLTFLCEKSLRKAALNRKAPMSIERHLSDWKWNDFPELRWEEDQGPSLHILGTGCNTGDQIVFEKTTIMRQSIDELQADAAASTSHATISKTNCPVSSAIAASAAFPPMLMPFRISKDSVNSDTQQEVAEFGEVEVADGGIIDNTGLAFSLCQGWGRDRSSILVSDAGKPFDWSTESLSVNSVASWFNRMDRAVSHIYRQCDRLMMHPSSRCHKVSISNSGHFKAREKVIDEYNHALDRAVALRVKDIQTDLDSLSRSEAFALVRMGYDLAGARLSAAYPVRIRKDNFFKGLWPSAELKGEATLVDAVGASISARQRERASLFTLYSSAPLKRWLMWALVIVLLLSLVGTWSILSYFWQIAFPEETVIEPMA